MDPWVAPALTGYSCEDFPSRTTKNCLLLRKEEIRPKWPAISHNLRFQRRQACQTLSKALDISSATSQVAPDLLKAIAILSDTTVTTFAFIYFQQMSSFLIFWKLYKNFQGCLPS